MALKTRKTLPAGGFFFYEAKTGWSPMAMMDFETTVNLIIEHRLANPRFKGQWATDFETVANELELQTCRQLASKGMAEQFCNDGGGFSFREGPTPLPQWLGRRLRENVAAVKQYVSGLKVLMEWIGEGGDPVSQELADSRSEVCAACPMNRPGKLADFFAEEASEQIKRQIAVKADMKLQSKREGELGVCSACLCPLGLKVWAPIEHVKKYLSKETEAKLDGGCWITKE
jgi:hypothetical protein